MDQLKMSGATILTVLIGTKSLFSEGVAAALEKSAFQIKESVASASEPVLPSLLKKGRALIIFTISGNIEISSFCKELKDFRSSYPEAIIVCLSPYYIQGEKFISSGATASFCGPLMAVELRGLLELTCDESASKFISLNCGLVDPKSPQARRSREVSRSMFSLDKQDHTVAAADLPYALAAIKPSLSSRECQILEGIVKGASNKVLARQFTLSESTVKAHVRAIFRKLGAQSRTQAVHKLYLQHKA